jgi:hypothetical protein
MDATMSKASRRFTARNCFAEISCSGEVIEMLKANLRRLIQWKSVVGENLPDEEEAISKLLPNVGFLAYHEWRNFLSYTISVDDITVSLPAQYFMYVVKSR